MVGKPPPSEKKRTFAQNLKAKMTSKGWNQAELARQANLGRDNINTYVNMSSFPGDTKFMAICKALDCDPDELCPGVISATDIMTDLPFEMKQVDGTGNGYGNFYFRVGATVDHKTAFAVADLMSKYHERQKRKKKKK